jgi:heme oxygenase
MSTLFAHLKSGTEQQHREIEALIDPMKNFCSLDAYKAHVFKTWLFYHPLEANLDKIDWSAVGIDFASRRKTLLLERDLTALSVPYTALNAGDWTLKRANLDFAIGCLYVLEGATLGGQVISRHLAKLGIVPENGGLFFNGYGAKTGQMWKSFQSSATTYCVTEDQIAEAVNGAKWTFEQFRESMLREELSAHVA